MSLYLNTEIGPGTVCESAIKEVVNAIIESGKTLSKEERKTERCPLAVPVAPEAVTQW